jgi:Domain of Unknown Function (DUF1080)
VQLKRGLHRFGKSLHGHILKFILIRRPGSITTIDRLIGIHQNNVERLVIVELKKREIQTVGLNDANANKLVHQLLNFFVALHNELIELAACLTRNTAKDDQHRLFRIPSCLIGAWQIVVNPPRVLFQLGFVAADFEVSLILLAEAESAEKNQSDYQTEAVSFHQRGSSASFMKEQAPEIIPQFTVDFNRAIAPFDRGRSANRGQVVYPKELPASPFPPSRSRISMSLRAFFSILALCVFACGVSNTFGQSSSLNTPPPGFTALFNGKDLSGWKGLAGKGGSPYERAKLSPEELKVDQAKADERMRSAWSVKDGVLVFNGKGDSLCTAKDYGDFELYVDFKIEKDGDSGIYLRGSPQVQIWDPATKAASGVGSGGLYNNQKNPSKPTKVADKPVGEWNTFFIRMVGEKVTIKLNGETVVDNVVLENYWNRDEPILATGQIELQNHGNTLYFRNIYLRELPRN